MSCVLWVFVSFLFTWVRFAPGALARARHEILTLVGANRQGAVVSGVDGVDCGFAEHPPRFVSVSRRGPSSGCCGPLPSPPLRPDNETDGLAPFLVVVVSLCFVATQCVGPNRGVPKGASPGGAGKLQVATGQGCFVGQGEADGLEPWGPRSQAPCVLAAGSRVVNFDKMLVLPLLSNPESRKEVSL